MAQPTIGDNINKKIDTTLVVNEFLEYFYQSWSTNPLIFAESGTIKAYSKMKYNDQIYEGEQMYQLLVNFYEGEPLIFTPISFNHLNDGSRKVYINVIGHMTKGAETKVFSQTLTLCHQKDHWYLQYSILIFLT